MKVDSERRCTIANETGREAHQQTAMRTGATGSHLTYVARCEVRQKREHHVRTGASVSRKDTKGPGSRQTR